MKQKKQIRHFLLLVIGSVLMLAISCKKDNKDNNSNIPTTVTDVDGNVYHTVVVGSQTWMVENLKTTKYRNGDLIGTTGYYWKDLTSETLPKYQWAYNGNETYVDLYGRLYTFYTATDSRGICPKGWHVPSSTEFSKLEQVVGGNTVAGGKFKETGTTHWKSPNTGATNSSGLNVLPSGYRDEYGTFYGLGWAAYIWTSSEYNMNNGDARNIRYDNSISDYFPDYKKSGLCVRCLKD